MEQELLRRKLPPTGEPVWRGILRYNEKNWRKPERSVAACIRGAISREKKEEMKILDIGTGPDSS